MQHRTLTPPARRHVLRLMPGEEVADTLTRWAQAHDIGAAHLSAIGAFERATLAFFDLGSRRYERIAVDEQVEVVSLSGTIARFEGAPRLHLHASLGRRDGTLLGGHLVSGVVQPTLEVWVDDIDAVLRRAEDPATGLALLDLT